MSNWRIQLRKGLLELCILNLLAQGEAHGYEMVKRLKQAGGVGIREGTIYPVLARLQTDGLVARRAEASSEGPPRKYFRLTSPGRTAVAAMNEHWKEISQSIEAIQEGTNE